MLPAGIDPSSPSSSRLSATPFNEARSRREGRIALGLILFGAAEISVVVSFGLLMMASIVLVLYASTRSPTEPGWAVELIVKYGAVILGYVIIPLQLTRAVACWMVSEMPRKQRDLVSVAGAAIGLLGALAGVLALVLDSTNGGLGDTLITAFMLAQPILSTLFFVRVSQLARAYALPKEAAAGTMIVAVSFVDALVRGIQALVHGTQGASRAGALVPTLVMFLALGIVIVRGLPMLWRVRVALLGSRARNR